MDVRKALSELYLERQQLEEAIISLEHLVQLSRKRRGQQSSWMRTSAGISATAYLHRVFIHYLLRRLRIAQGLVDYQHLYRR